MFSVVIPTYKRDEDLEGALKSLRENTEDTDLEIIVLHPGFDSTVDLCAKYGALSVLDNARQNGKRVKSLWAIINDGIRMAKNPFVMYLNDDCLVLPGWDTTAARYFQDAKLGLLILKTKGIGQDPNFRVVMNADGVPCANYGILNRNAGVLFDEGFDWFFGDADIPKRILLKSDFHYTCTEENMVIHNHTIDDNRMQNESQLKQIQKDSHRFYKNWRYYSFKDGKCMRDNVFVIIGKWLMDCARTVKGVLK